MAEAMLHTARVGADATPAHIETDAANPLPNGLESQLYIAWLVTLAGRLDDRAEVPIRWAVVIVSRKGRVVRQIEKFGAEIEVRALRNRERFLQ